MTIYGTIIDAKAPSRRKNLAAVIVAGVLALGVCVAVASSHEYKPEASLEAVPPPASEQDDDCHKDLAFYTLIGNGREATFKKSGVAGRRGPRTDPATRRRRRARAGARRDDAHREAEAGRRGPRTDRRRVAAAGHAARARPRRASRT